MKVETEVEELNKVVNLLSEHYDSTTIFVSRLESDGTTTSLSVGSGNWFARIGQIGTWLQRETIEGLRGK